MRIKPPQLYGEAKKQFYEIIKTLKKEETTMEKELLKYVRNKKITRPFILYIMIEDFILINRNNYLKIWYGLKEGVKRDAGELRKKFDKFYEVVNKKISKHEDISDTLKILLE